MSKPFFYNNVWKPTRAFTTPGFAATRCFGTEPTKTTRYVTLRLRRVGPGNCFITTSRSLPGTCFAPPSFAVGCCIRIETVEITLHKMNAVWL